MPAENLKIADFETVEEVGAVSFLKNVGKGVAEALKKSLTPLHLVSDKIPAFRLYRKLYKRQSHTAEATRKVLFNRFQDGQKWYPYSRTALIVGEMGVGKCIMGCYVINGVQHLVVEANGKTEIIKCDKSRPVNIALLGPTTLCEKWEREIKETIPKARVINCNGQDSLQKFAQLQHNTYTDGPTIWIMGETRNYRHVRHEPYAVKNKYGYAACPDCGKTLYFKMPKEKEEREISLEEFYGLKKHRNKCCHCNAALWKPVQAKKPESFSLKNCLVINKDDKVACPSCESTLEFKIPKAKREKEGLKRATKTVSKKQFDALKEENAAEYFATDLNQRCSHCLKPLWAHKTKHEVSPSYFAAKKLKKLARQNTLPMIDLAVVDEAHEIKGDGPMGWLAGCLLQSAKRQLLLTGTLTGGYAENLWYLFWRTMPAAMRREGFTYGKIRPWIKEYGALETKMELVVDKKDGEEKVKSTSRPVAGISARIYTRFLMNRAIFLQLAELGLDLPAYKEHEVGIEMDPELEEAYLEYDKNFKAVLQKISDPSVRKKDAVTVSHTGIHRLMQFLDSLQASRIAGKYITVDEKGKETEHEFDIPMPELDLPTTAKERQAVDIALASRANGRRTLFFVNYTKERDCIGRLYKTLTDAGLNVGVLRENTVRSEKREKWIREHNFDCLICHPDLVRTGLDLLEYPDIVFYQATYNIYTLRQAARRSWRIGQTKPVHVYFLYYRRSIQHTAMQVIASKLDSALLAEGVINDSEVFKLSSSRDGVLRDMAKAMLKGDIEEFSLGKREAINLDELLAMNVADLAKGGITEEVKDEEESREEVIVDKITKVLAHLIRKEGRKKIAQIVETSVEEVPTGTQFCLF